MFFICVSPTSRGYNNQKKKDSTQPAFTGLGELGILDLLSPGEGIGGCFFLLYVSTKPIFSCYVMLVSREGIKETPYMLRGSIHPEH